MFAKNCWYVVANNEDIKVGEPLARTVAGEDLVFYRNTQNKVVAMLDLCPHRLAPLSMGKVEGDDIRCMYHGIVFSPEGLCKEIPGQENIPKSMCTVPYSVYEGFELVWVWIGDQDKVDESLIPDQSFHDPAVFNVRKSSVPFEASYELFTDNTCDLSHVAYVHAATFASIGSDEWSQKQPITRLKDRSVEVDRWMTSIPHPMMEGKKVDFSSRFKVELPGVFIMDTQVHPEGTAEKLGYGDPTDDLQPLHQSCTIQVMRPISETSSEFFFSICTPKWVPDEVLEMDFEFALSGFKEDKTMIEAQQRMISRHPDKPLRKTSHDLAGTHMRKLVRATHN